MIRSFPQVTVLLEETSKTRQTSAEQEVKKMSSVQESAALQRQSKDGAPREPSVCTMFPFTLDFA